MPKDCYVVQPLKVWSKKKWCTHILIPEKSGLTQSLEEINLSKIFFGVGPSNQSMSKFFQ